MNAKTGASKNSDCSRELIDADWERPQQNLNSREHSSKHSFRVYGCRGIGFSLGFSFQ